MNFVPWWQGEFLRQKLSGFGWALIAMPPLGAVVVWWFSPARVGELGDAVPAFLGVIALGVALLVIERRLRPRHHHAQVLYVDMPGVKPCHYSICECRWFGGVSDDSETAFAQAREHTADVDEDVVSVFDETEDRGH